MNELVSIIVPVYNASQYLAETVTSLIAQTYKNIEILLVDDGSSDNSMTIAKDFANKDSRVKAIPKGHTGVTITRKYGVDHSAGTWIMFVDADDTLPEDAVKFLICQTTNNETVDLVLGTWRNVSSTFSRKGIILLKGDISSSEYIRALLIGYIPFGIMGKIIRKESFIKSRVFDKVPAEITNNEDLLMNIILAQTFRNIKVCPEHIVYNYIKHNNSASRRSSPVKCWDCLFEVLGKNLLPRYKQEYWNFVLLTMVRQTMIFSDLDFRESSFYKIISNQHLSFRNTIYLSYLHNQSKLNIIMAKILFSLYRIRRFILSNFTIFR